ncbi:hypothetical protein [Neobacillus sp.]|uniref:hypothetical protein n=1 Tax=Neobacillus sp. TaxID=2675273 RepID=UPI00289DBEA0|nr:hypothetical protein [Neobacillus sp.]
MKLIFENQTIHFDRFPSVEEIFDKIKEFLSDQYFFSHLKIDGEEVYDDPESYLLECLESISIIEVVVKTIHEFVNEVLHMTDDYLKRAIPEITTVADGFYQSPSSNNWTDFSNMLEGIQWLIQMVELIDKTNERPANWDECIKITTKFEMELASLVEAVKNTDHILIADVLQYELLPLFETLETEVKNTIDIEGKRNDIN